MKIVFTIPKLTYSGAPKMIAWIANQMANRGHAVHLITFFMGKQNQAVNKNVQIHQLNVLQSEHRIVRNTIGMIKTIVQLHKTVKSIAFSLLLC